MIAVLVLTALSLLIMYFVVRKAVPHGILDADESRRERASLHSRHGPADPR